MSKKTGFKEKQVRLQLPNCPMVVFDPTTCEWTTQNSEEAEKRKIEEQITRLSKSVIEMQKEVDVKKKTADKFEQQWKESSQGAQETREKINKYKAEYLYLNELKTEIDAKFKELKQNH